MKLFQISGFIQTELFNKNIEMKNLMYLLFIYMLLTDINPVPSGTEHKPLTKPSCPCTEDTHCRLDRSHARIYKQQTFKLKHSNFIQIIHNLKFTNQACIRFSIIKN